MSNRYRCDICGKDHLQQDQRKVLTISIGDIFNYSREAHLYGDICLECYKPYVNDLKLKGFELSSDCNLARMVGSSKVVNELEQEECTK